MHIVRLPRIGTATAWRDAARDCLQKGQAPEDVQWVFAEEGQASLFAANDRLSTKVAPQILAEDLPANFPRKSEITVPKSFLDLANAVVWHADPERFARLYAFLCRLQDNPRLISDRGDAALATLRGMEKNVRRCAHKMKAFVRFRDLGVDGPRRRFAAWFEPTHHTVEPTAPFFTRRFGDMDWIIVTPDVTARFEDGRLTFADGQRRPDLPEDATEDLWGTYFRNIFNPARLKVQAMTSEMPKKYWKNMPEARHIPHLIATAETRAREMAAAAPTLPPARTERIRALHQPAPAPVTSFEDLRARAAEENRTEREGYGRIVLGEGPADARLMIVGEQPGDHEDRAGRPFVGPAGQLFDRVAAEAGLDRASAYVTNAVKRFKFQQRGKRRLHQPPNRTEIEHGRWWLEMEHKLVAPDLIVAMGATALQALTGSRDGLLKRRGGIEDTRYGPVFVTVHPSFLLRIPDEQRKRQEMEAFRADLAAVADRMRHAA